MKYSLTVTDFVTYHIDILSLGTLEGSSNLCGLKYSLTVRDFVAYHIDILSLGTLGGSSNLCGLKYSLTVRDFVAYHIDILSLGTLEGRSIGQAGNPLSHRPTHCRYTDLRYSRSRADTNLGIEQDISYSIQVGAQSCKY